MKNIPKLFVLAVLVILTNSIQSQTLQRVWSVPRSGTFWSMQLTNQPPMPCLPDFLPNSTPIYQVTNGVYVYDDRSVDYAAVNEVVQAANSVSYPPAPGSGSYVQGGTSIYFGPKYGSNDFYLSILLDTNNPGNADLVLHNASSPTTYYQLLTNTILTTPLMWFPGQWKQGDASTNDV